MEINISHLISSDDFVPFDLSNNRLTLGDNAGQLTWAAAVETANKLTLTADGRALLDTEEKRQEFRDYIRGFGAWSPAEIAAWSDTELNALLLQMIAGDIREAFDDAEPSAWDWEKYQEEAQRGSIHGNLFRTDAGEVFYSVTD